MKRKKRIIRMLCRCSGGVGPGSWGVLARAAGRRRSSLPWTERT